MRTVNIGATVEYDDEIGRVIYADEKMVQIEFGYDYVIPVKHVEYKVIEDYQAMYKQEKERADRYERMWKGFKNLMEVERAAADEGGDNVDYDTFYYVVEKMKQYEQENAK